MTKYIKIKQDYNGAIELYKYDKDFRFDFNEYFLIETHFGQDLGKIIPNSITQKEIENVNPNLKLIRQANQEDFDHQSECKNKADKAFEITKNKIQEHDLSMKLISIYFFLDGNKILFNFTAEGRIDFRDLVKDLASTFKTRIELRQIGVRDESMLLGGHGVCGREFCCRNKHGHGEPISIRMAKEQNLTLNSVKISGVCGRLMCCLDFETDRNSDYPGQNDVPPVSKSCGNCCKSSKNSKELLPQNEQMIS